MVGDNSDYRLLTGYDLRVNLGGGLTNLFLKTCISAPVGNVIHEKEWWGLRCPFGHGLHDLKKTLKPVFYLFKPAAYLQVAVQERTHELQKKQHAR